MSAIFNIYCDESCHLENDRQPIMVLGGISLPANRARTVSLAVRKLKRRHGLADAFEIKWTKVSPAKVDFYREVVELFFAEEAMSFRGLVVPNKAALRHLDFSQTHDEWYYKMYYLLLRPLLHKKRKFRVYLDIKDTRGGEKVRRLENYLKRFLRDWEQNVLESIQLVHSRELASLQIVDLLIGAVAYVQRDLSANAGKTALADLIRSRSGLTLQHSTAPGRPKFDLFVWEANAGDL